MPRVRIVSVTKTYGTITALRDVNLEVRDREYLSIVGPSGCGKTTLIKCVAGIVQPDKGDVYIDEKPVKALPIEDRGVGYVFQEIALFPHMTVLENVSYGLMAKGVPPGKRRRQVREVLELMALSNRASAYSGELSGGARQKTAVARALTSGSSLLLLDEPLGALDAKVRAVLRYELRSLVKDLNLTAIHVTHDQEEALLISDRIAVMKAGHIIEVGTPWDLYMYPKNIFTAKFLGEASFMEGKVIEVLGEEYLIDVAGLTLRARAGADLSLKEGEACVLAIRPEFVALNAKGRPPGPNRWKGTIRAEAFVGDAIRYEVEAENGITVSVKHPIFLGETDLQVGDRVSIEMPMSHVLVYRYPKEGLERELSLE